MTASVGVSGFGTKLIWNYSRVLELSSINGPSETLDTIDVTSHDSPDAYKEFVAGLKSGGEISLEGNLITRDATGQIAFHTDLQAGTFRTGYIVLPMALGKSFVFSGIAKGFPITIPYDDKVGMSGSIQIAGKPVLLLTQSAGMSGLVGIEHAAGAALTITPVIAVGTYAYVCAVDTTSTWVKLTVTAATHTVYVQGVLEATTVQTGEIALGAAGTTTEIFIMVFEANKSPRLYILTVTRPLP